MEKDRIKKLKKYIKDDRPSKLKSFVRKHELNLTEAELSKGRSLLHYCCQHGSGIVLRYLLHEGTDPLEPDNSGSLPLHVALQRALDAGIQQAKEVYTELVLPLLETAPEALDEKNYKHVSCRELLEEVVDRNTHQMHEEKDVDCEYDWDEKLADELSREQEESWGRYNTENDFWEEHTQESYDQWADRLYSDYNLKQRHKNGSQHAHSHEKRNHQNEPKTKKSRVIDEEELRRTREKLKRKYEENQKQDIQNHKTRRKCLYEKNFSSLLKSRESQLTFNDIPWPGKGSTSEIIEVMFCDIPDRSCPQFKKYLRDQQVRWHPDKFTQKFGKRLVEAEKERIMDRVKEISQALNKLSDTLPC